jgi:metallo-beta-lactamase family protein
MSKVKITFAGGAQSPTGSNFLLEYGNRKILVDCGLSQGSKIADDLNRADFIYDAKTVDLLVVTHAHLDHVGRIPKLMSAGFTGPIYSTIPTRDMGELIMIDSLGVLTKEAEKHGQEPIYKEADVTNALRNWQTVKYHDPIPLDTEDGPIVIKFYDAGHILGSSMVVFEIKGKKIMFTGDLGNSPSMLMPDTEVVKGIDYLCIESVYGDRNHEDISQRRELLKGIMKKTLFRGGTLMIPAFSIERTQEMLYIFNEMVESHEIDRVPVYMDSPLAIHITAIYKKYHDYLNKKANGESHTDDIFKFPGLVETLSTDDSKAINHDSRPKIIIAGSGMSNGGRILHHEKNYLPDRRSTLLLVGYQAVGTMGRFLQEGAKSVRIHGEDVKVNAEIANISGFSAHKDSDHLVELVGEMSESIKKVFVILGEPKSSNFLAQKIYEYFGLNVRVPEKNEVVEIEL